jgi:hypothetical protein
MPIGLPTNPDLEHFRRQARTLQRSARSGDPDALALVEQLHTGPVDTADLPLSAAQLVIARRYGFSSWPKLRHYLDDASELSRNPTGDQPADSPADEFCRLACLVYGNEDGPERWAGARALLAEHPELVTVSIAAAAAAADPDAIAGHLATDPAAAGRDTGPHRWAPLLYLTYSRVQTAGEPAERFLRSMRLLLDAGADPNAGYLWLGLPTPFTVLTGVFGEGEQGAGKQPRHPHSLPLARLLLTSGADPNDGQALYNRMFRPDDSHLDVLYEFGLGRGDGGPWKRRLGEAAETIQQMMARQLQWAIDHGFDRRVRLLISRGVDVSAPLADGRTPAEHAIAAGRLDLLADLRAAGAPVRAVTDAEELTGLLLAGDKAAIDAFEVDHPNALAAARQRNPAVLHQARTAQAVNAVMAAGFDVNARAGGSTALHEAAFVGDVTLIAALLDAGADPSLLDDENRSTPLGWAQYAHQGAAAQMLAAVTPE